MNLQPYRSSFVVFIADSNLERGSGIVTALSDTGYICEHRLNRETLLEEVLKNPPHIILFFYNDSHFFSDERSYENMIEKLQHHLPEVHIVFLCEEAHLNQACNLYEFGVYDCLTWPLHHPMQLLRSVDRAAENDYYMYLNEQLKEGVSSQGSPADDDFAMFNVWLRELDATQNREQAIQLWMREAVRVFQTDEAIYFRYIETKRSLVATDSVGIAAQDLQNVGLDLAEKEPGFHTEMLFEPHRILAFHEFVTQGLLRSQALYFSLIYDGHVLGVIFIPAKKMQIFSDNQADSGYMQSCLKMLQKHFYALELKKKLGKFSIYDDESEALSAEFLLKKIKEEVSRARRIARPVSLLYISLDAYEDLMLKLTAESSAKLLKSFTEILIKNSRLNDLVGRFDRDQFILCLPHTEKRGAAVKAERLRRIIESADVSSIVGGDSKVTVSIGVSEYPTICHDANGLIRSAEAAMLEVKRVGSNRICLAAAPARFVPDFIVKDAKSVASHNS